MTEEQMIVRLYNRHLIRQPEIQFQSGDKADSSDLISRVRVWWNMMDVFMGGVKACF